MSTEIKTYHYFNDYYADANALVRSKHDDFHIFRFSEIGNNIVPKMGPFRKTYYHFVIASVLPAKVDVFDISTITESYSLVIYLPGQVVHWEKTGDWNGYLINVRESFLNLESMSNLTESYGFLHRLQPLVLNISESDYELLSSFYELMLMEHLHMKAENILVIRNLMQVMMVYINRIVSKTQAMETFVELKYQKIATKFKTLVYKQYQTSKDVSHFARQLGVTPAYLYESTKKVYNESPKDIINKIIFLHAKTMLSKSDTGVKELAWSLNFDDYSHFVKFFKKMSGYSPAEFRKIISAR